MAWRAMGGVGRWLGCLFVVSLSSCGPARTSALRPAALPSDQTLRRESLEQLARGLFEAIRQEYPDQVLAAPAELDQLLPVHTRSRIEQERLHQVAFTRVPGHPAVWREASYAGFCAQGAREEPAGGPLGLSEAAWTVERVLVAADLGRARSASWVEGRFLFTDRGFRALTLSRVEAPRTGHSDLDLAPCDVEQGIR